MMIKMIFSIYSVRKRLLAKRLYSSGISSPLCVSNRAFIGLDFGDSASGPIAKEIKKIFVEQLPIISKALNWVE